MRTLSHFQMHLLSGVSSVLTANAVSSATLNLGIDFLKATYWYKQYVTCYSELYHSGGLKNILLSNDHSQHFSRLSQFIIY